MTDKENNSAYSIITEKDRLIFRTSSFQAEKTSMLHGGVYTEEFSSMLLASAACILAYMYIVSVIHILLLRYIILVLIFIAAFLGANRYIFKKRSLEADFDRTRRTVKITRPRIIANDVEIIPYAKISSVEMGAEIIVPENIDGIRFVQKISFQHGSAMPGLGDEEEFITLSLKLTDGTKRTIYAGKTAEGPAVPVNEIKNFIMNKEI